MTALSRNVASVIKRSSFEIFPAVAAFSEYQHEGLLGLGPNDNLGGIKKEFKGQPIVIQSNELRLRFDGKTWSVQEK
jgi:hypothetical protein